MLTVPASNWSVPPTVVMRMRSSVPERVTPPAPYTAALSLLYMLKIAFQILELVFDMTNAPVSKFVAIPERIAMPVVLVLVPDESDEPDAEL